MEGVGHRAVSVGGLIIALSHTGGCRALPIGKGALHQILIQVQQYRLLLRSLDHSRVAGGHLTHQSRLEGKAVFILPAAAEQSKAQAQCQHSGAHLLPYFHIKTPY